MTRTELIDALAAEAEMDKRDAKRFLEGLTQLVERTIRAGGEVPLKGLGKFKVQNRKARVGRNPMTGEPVNIPAKTVVKFTVAKSLKDLAT
jgi:DNA-binding protein HU-alpha